MGAIYSRQTKKGFTLLELLIVVAVLAVIMGIVYGLSVSQKNAGSDAAVKKVLVGIRSQAQLLSVNSNNSFATVCADTKIRSMVQSAARAGGIVPNAAAYADTDVGAWNAEACHDTATTYVIWVPLKDSTAAVTSAWCVDSTNASRRITGAGATLANGATACP